ncbi:hypothetical protein CHH28_19320 [Bacterioplanes sanyensis]|uniref:Thiol oxidoreductase n=1 Tax=Bacterioplanes sanyensis TaxID=1249553 RepID=A0A222FQ94_9GAMM|nr:di-heme oxidoredictase family protein [Bacterioplanes sanyensis]ASP40686.1 hypothetical protein CHH28_19320 [Bacterioplanes sanyensis]
MTSRCTSISALLLATLLIGCSEAPDSTDQRAPDYDPAEALPGGDTSVNIVPFPSSELPAANLPPALKPDFFAGKALAHQPWVKAPTVTDIRDGLGPLYNARTCLACHTKGGRGHVPDSADVPLLSAFLRLSIPGEDPIHGAIAEPTYGDQLQSQSVALGHQLRASQPDLPMSVAPEAYVHVHWQPETFVYPDGEQRQLRRPRVELKQLGYGPLHPDTTMSLRIAPAIHGAGLIEMIDQADIDALADPNDQNGDGISGRVNQVWDYRRQVAAPGRFGLKANRATLEITVAGAFAGDVGITNALFPQQPCSERQSDCLRQPDGNDAHGSELRDDLLDLVINFNRNIGVPKRRSPTAKTVLAGRERFYQAGCQQCHQPSFTTQTSSEFPHLSAQRIWPYSDFLLHNMGPDLADGRSDYQASGREWRTAPLWGLGLSQQISGSRHFLHDGRARSVEEAILWHGGEASDSRQRFVQFTHEQRQQLLTFVNSL